VRCGSEAAAAEEAADTADCVGDTECRHGPIRDLEYRNPEPAAEHREGTRAAERRAEKSETGRQQQGAQRAQPHALDDRVQQHRAREGTGDRQPDGGDARAEVELRLVRGMQRAAGGDGDCDAEQHAVAGDRELPIAELQDGEDRMHLRA
jgi:hypothetical protein